MTAHTLRLSGLALILTTCIGAAVGEAPAKKEPKPQVEVVFCLDTTGSMGGLIDAAKRKIWTIANQIASGKPTPRLKIGLVAYRDRGDQYITRIFDLTDDLDAVYGHLMEFRAEGGGDAPESVNQALHESVTKINWSADKKALKIIFLVGDCPPHLDYANDVQYPETCKRAVEKRIIINTVQCGNDRQTQDIWERICRLAEGRYVQIDANGGSVLTVATPYDSELAKINGELAGSALTYGRSRGMAMEKLAVAKRSPPPPRPSGPPTPPNQAAPPTTTCWTISRRTRCSCKTSRRTTSPSSSRDCPSRSSARISKNSINAAKPS